jgi:GNAT superfamily N-acetyltransferase
MPFRLRCATEQDADAIAEVYFASFRLLTFLPMLHTLESYRWYVANVMLKECAVTVAEDDTGIVSFLGLKGEEFGQFYTRPDRIGRGAGTQLIEAAKSSGVAALELGCFQANARARHSTRRATSARSALPTAPTTRSGCRTFAIAGTGSRPSSAISAHDPTGPILGAAANDGYGASRAVPAAKAE